MATTLGNGTITFGDGTTLDTASMIKSIQRGTSNPSGAYQPWAINISAVTTSKCMAIIGGAANDGASAYSGTIYLNAFVSSTQFTVYAGGTNMYAVGWQIIEFK